MFYYLKDDLANSERVWLDALHEAVKAIGALLDDRRAGNVKLEPLPSEFDEAELKLKEAELEVRYFHDAMLENFWPIMFELQFHPGVPYWAIWSCYLCS